MGRRRIEAIQADAPEAPPREEPKKYHLQRARLNQRRDAAVFSRNMRDVTYMWDSYEAEDVSGPADERTRYRAVEMLVRAQRTMGGTRKDVGRYLSVGLNYKPRQLRDGMIRYELVYELFVHIPVLFGRYADRTLAKYDGRKDRLLRDKGVSVKDPRNAEYIDVYVAPIVKMDVDMTNGTGYIKAGSADTDDLFEVRFSLDTETLREDDESKKVMAWLNGIIEDDMSEDW